MKKARNKGRDFFIGQMKLVGIVGNHRIVIATSDWGGGTVLDDAVDRNFSVRFL